MEHPFLMFLDHTQRHTTVGRTLLDVCSARRRDLYLTTHDTRNRQISMPPVGFEPTISAGERPAAARLSICLKNSKSKANSNNVILSLQIKCVCYLFFRDFRFSPFPLLFCYLFHPFLFSLWGILEFRRNRIYIVCLDEPRFPS